MVKKLLGTVSHYYARINVAVIDLVEDMRVGDRISIEGPSTDVHQTVNSMQIDKENVKTVKGGNQVGLRVEGTVKVGDNVYLD